MKNKDMAVFLRRHAAWLIRQAATFTEEADRLDPPRPDEADVRQSIRDFVRGDDEAFGLVEMPGLEATTDGRAR